MEKVETLAETIVDLVKGLEKERDEKENALYLARLLRKDLFSLGRVRYAEFPWVENKAPSRLSVGLRQAVSIFCEVTEEEDTLVYYAGCGCCQMQIWRDEIIKTSAKKVILITDMGIDGIQSRYFDAIKEAGKNLVVISIKEKENKKA